MDSLIKELANVLENEARIYDDILRISNNKTKIIVKGKINELENVTKLEQTLVLQLGRLEGMREELLNKICEHMDVKDSQINVSQLIDRLKSEHADKLKSCQQKLISTITKLKETNDLNSRLIKNSLEYIDFSVNLMAGATAPNNNYGSAGQVNDAKKKNFFDMKL